MIQRWHWLSGQPIPIGPFIASGRLLDIPETMIGVINNLPSNCVGVAIRLHPLYAFSMVTECERAARRKGIRLFWLRRRKGQL